MELKEIPGKSNKNKETFDFQCSYSSEDEVEFSGDQNVIREKFLLVHA